MIENSQTNHRRLFAVICIYLKYRIEGKIIRETCSNEEKCDKLYQPVDSNDEGHSKQI